MIQHATFAALAALSTCTCVAAHPPDQRGRHDDDIASATSRASAARVWTNERTGETVRGWFLACRDRTVSIERDSGEVARFLFNDLSAPDRVEAARQIADAGAINQFALASSTQPAAPTAPNSKDAAAPKPSQAAPFDLFAPFVKTRWDDRWLYIESDGLPHAPVTYPLMVGIKSWQQQVPLPQSYIGANAWQIPLKPELAEKPISAKTQLYRGAIALAANGVPIFNALNNRGDDTLKVGELDDFGGHSGRGDDYHYHIAPLALQKVVGNDKPIAYALDGFPLYGLFDPAAKPGDDRACPIGGTAALDELNGHFSSNADGSKGLYHYHASVGYPYINGGMRGKVTVRDDQIDPQPRAHPIRQWLQPLRGAAITGFKSLADKSWSLEYTLSGKKHLVNYRLEEDGKYTFDFIDPDGSRKTETYDSRPDRDRPPGGDDHPRRGGRPGGRDDRGVPPPSDKSPSATANTTGFTIASPAVGAAGKLPAEFTCDGASLAPPLTWTNVPEGTKSFAITMHHIPGPPRPGDRPGEDKHVYLVVYNLPASAHAVDKGDSKSGTRGVNTVNRRAEYAPPCSKGPGLKTYTLTVYALSCEPVLAPAKEIGAAGPTMEALLAAFKDKVLATATLDVKYERPSAR